MIQLYRTRISYILWSESDHNLGRRTLTKIGKLVKADFTLHDPSITHVSLFDDDGWQAIHEYL